MPAIYAVLALLALVENFLPPVPADTAVALGAFLAARGVVDLRMVLLVTVLSTVAGAAAVYVLARGPGGTGAEFQRTGAAVPTRRGKTQFRVTRLRVGENGEIRSRKGAHVRQQFLAGNSSRAAQMHNRQTAKPDEHATPTTRHQDPTAD